MDNEKKIESLLDTIGELSADADDFVEKYQDDFNKRVIDIAADPAARDEEIFEKFGLDVDIVPDDFVQSKEERNKPNYYINLAGFMAACKAQAFLEFADELIEKSYMRSLDIKEESLFVDDKDVKTQAAITGVSKKRIKRLRDAKR